ncbi:unnamed protein product, partial [Anisakis simplex]|uniref:Bromo domain-containing protein n=1 Tax=Anisakis simplex TaxID=6269 RepID=A0A0M3J2P1_ANISI
PPQSPSKITPEKQKREEGVKFSSGKKEVKQEADRYLPQICVDPKPRLLSNVDDEMKREKVDWSQRIVEDYLLGHSEFSHISELILWEILLIRKEDYGFYLNPVIREYLNKIKVLKYMDGKVHVEINQLADQIAGLWRNSNNLTKLAELWKILMSDELRNVFIIEAIPNNNGLNY